MHDPTPAWHGPPQGGVWHLLVLPPFCLRIPLATCDHSGHSCEAPETIAPSPTPGPPHGIAPEAGRRESRIQAVAPTAGQTPFVRQAYRAWSLPCHRPSSKADYCSAGGRVSRRHSTLMYTKDGLATNGIKLEKPKRGGHSKSGVLRRADPREISVAFAAPRTPIASRIIEKTSSTTTSQI